MAFILVPGIWGPTYIRADLIVAVVDDGDNSCLVWLERPPEKGPIVVKVSAADVMDLMIQAKYTDRMVL